MRYLVGFFLLLICRSSEASYGSRLVLVEKLQTQLGVTRDYLKNANYKNLKLAILSPALSLQKSDKPAGPSYLPEGTVVMRGAEVFEETARMDWDGRRLAQALHALLNFQDKSPEYRLFVVNSPKDFRDAVAQAREWGASIILSTSLFPFFGNFDGTGPINRIIDEFIDGGGFWVQSVGQYHQRVYDGQMAANLSRSRIPFNITADETPVRLTLSWKGLTEGGQVGTDTDLDLRLLKPDGSLIKSSEWRQVTFKPSERLKQTNLATEQLDITLNSEKESYTLEVLRLSSGNRPVPFRIVFSSAKRIYLDEVQNKLTDPISIPSAGPNSILVPADNRNALSVGSNTPTDSRGTTTDGRSKPDLTIAKASLYFSDGVSLLGSDAAAAQIAAIAALVRSIDPTAKIVQFKRALSSSSEKELKLPPFQSIKEYFQAD